MSSEEYYFEDDTEDDIYQTLDDHKSYIYIGFLETKFLGNLCKMIMKISSKLRLRFHKKGIDIMESDNNNIITIIARLKKDDLYRYIYNVKQNQKYLTINMDAKKFSEIIAIEKTVSCTLRLAFNEEGNPYKMIFGLDTIRSGGEIVNVQLSDESDEMIDYFKEYYRNDNILSKLPTHNFSKIVKLMDKGRSDKIEFSLDTDGNFTIYGKNGPYQECFYTYPSEDALDKISNIDEIEEEYQDEKEQNIISEDSFDIIEDDSLHSIEVGCNITKHLANISGLSPSKSMIKVFYKQENPLIFVTPLSNIGIVQIIFHKDK